MREVQMKVYTVGELSEQAREKAYSDWYQHAGYGRGGENEATLEAFEAVFPVSITTWEYDQWGGYVRFEFTEDFDIEDLTGIRLATYIYNNYYHRITKGKYYSLWSKTTDRMREVKSRHSKVIIEEGCCPLTGYYMDDVMLDPIFNFMKKPDAHTNFADLMDACFKAWAKASSEDYAHSLSMEYFLDEAESNGYEYYEDGTQF